MNVSSSISSFEGQTCLQNPAQVQKSQVVEVAEKALKYIYDCRYAQQVGLRESVLKAVKIWWCQAEEIDDADTVKKAHKLCQQLVEEAILFEPEPYQDLLVTLQDKANIKLTPFEYEMLSISTIHLDLVLNSGFRETTERKVVLDIPYGILKQIFLKIKNHDHIFPADINKLELLNAASYLGIEFLRKEILKSLENFVAGADTTKFAEVLTVCVEVAEKTYLSQEVVKIYHMKLIEILLDKGGRSKLMKSLRIYVVDKLIPGVTFSTKNFIAKVDITLNDRYQYLRYILYAGAYIHRDQPKKAAEFLAGLAATQEFGPLLYLKSRLESMN